MKRLKLTTPKDIRHALQRVANMVINDELEIKKANTITNTCNVILSSIRIDEQEVKLTALEKLVLEQELANKTCH